MAGLVSRICPTCTCIILYRRSGQSRAGLRITICGGPSWHDSTTLNVATIIIKSIVCAILCNEGKIQEFRHALVAACVANDPIMYQLQSQNNIAI